MSDWVFINAGGDVTVAWVAIWRRRSWRRRRLSAVVGIVGIRAIRLLPVWWTAVIIVATTLVRRRRRIGRRSGIRLRLQRRKVLLRLTGRRLMAGRRVAIDGIGRCVSRVGRIATSRSCRRRAVTTGVVDGGQSN